MAGKKWMWAMRVVIAAVAIGAPATGADAQAPSEEWGERHCVVEVLDDTDGTLTTGSEQCYASFADAQEHASRGTKSPSARGTAESQNAPTAASSTIGVHFTGTSYTGSSITITGSVCSGGVWYPTGSWNNNIASSYHYCGSSATRFYDSSLCSGTSLAIYSAASTLGSMNDRASCVRYG